MTRIILSLFIFLITITSCSVTRNGISGKAVTIHSLKYLGEYIVPYNHQFKGTTVGGLSGIDYDAKQDVYYLICDDRSERNPARFYTAKINIAPQGISIVEFVNVTTLLSTSGNPYPDTKIEPANSPDPEAMRYNPILDQLIWTNEGERIVKKEITLQQPAITIINKEGKYIDTFSLPAQIHNYETEKGLRRNSSFEGLTFADNYKTMFVSVEEPLYEDGPRAALQDAAVYTRIIKYDMVSHKPVAQYAYHLSPVAHPAKPVTEFMINGIPDILSIDKNKLLVVERSFSTGVSACTIRVYITDLTNATNIADIQSLILQPPAYPESKRLLINMDELGIYIDNIEGVTFGPDLPNGHKTLIFVSDNNFAKEQKTQFLLFEVN
ncbi:MAG TPA: esterase-like activity of phytase family protein [Chitinophagaceae bacterium]|nr:esterase-like activity of phytase family protein [Chitinophagaceae bacterium]